MEMRPQPLPQKGTLNGMLTPSHREELANSAISRETIDASGIRSCFAPREIQAILGWNNPPKCGGMVFPFRNLQGEFTGFSRVKLDTPRKSRKKTADGKVEERIVKYEQPIGAAARAYFTPGVGEAIARRERIYITEGEKKSLAMHDHIGPTIGLTGVWNFAKKREEGKDRELIDDLLQINWSGLPVVVVFDADDENKSGVEHARCELARVLERYGAKVVIKSLDRWRTYGKGVDDILFAGVTGIEIHDYLTAGEFDIELPTLEKQKQQLASSPGIYFCGAEPGTGKTSSDRVLLEASSKSLTVVPRHAQCKDLEVLYQGWGLNAVAYPELNEETCLNFEEASDAMKLGFAPSTAVCYRCPHKNECIYRQAAERAEQADHQIITAGRWRRTMVAAADGRSLVLIHEQATDSVCADYRLVSDAAKSWLEALTIFDLGVAATLGEVVTKSRRQWCEILRRTADWIAMVLGGHASPIQRPGAVLEPHGALGDLFQALRPIFRDRFASVGSRLTEEGTARGDTPEAIRKAIRHHRGVLQQYVQLIVQAATTNASGRAGTWEVQPELRKILWEVVPRFSPSHSVWIQDSSADPWVIQHAVSRAIGATIRCVETVRPVYQQPVWQLTTSDRLAVTGDVHPIKGLPGGITRNTKPEVVKSLAASILGSLPRSMTPVGVICHSCHEDAIRELLGPLKSILGKIDHFGGAETRGSNNWHNTCNSLLVLGTPRVGSLAVLERATLRRESDEPQRQSSHEIRYWSGRGPDGLRRTVSWLGYADRWMDLAFRELVLAELVQCVGRGRPHLPTGIPVLVVGNEPLARWNFAFGDLGESDAHVVTGGAALLRWPELIQFHGRRPGEAEVADVIGAKSARILFAAIRRDPNQIGWIRRGVFWFPWMAPVVPGTKMSK